MGNKEAIETAITRAKIAPQGNVKPFFNARFLKMEPCRDRILGRLHPQGAACPECTHSIKSEKMLKNFWTGRRCTCAHCKIRFTALSGTLFQGTHLNFKEIFLITFLLGLQAEGLNISSIAKAVGVSENTTRRWIKKFKIIEEIKNQEEKIV